MSETKLVFRKLVALFVAGVIGVLFIGNLVPVRAQLPSEPSTPNFGTTTSLEEFRLDANAEPIMPEELGQSELPVEGGRLILGPDNRVPVSSTKYPWSSVGRVEGVTADGDGYICTGTLVRADVVLTNAHCVIDPETHKWSQTVRFAPNLINGRLQNEGDRAGATEIIAGTDFRDTGGELSPDDWALMRIDKPLGFKYGTLSMSVVSASILSQFPEEFSVVGYSGDFPPNSPGETASAHLGCSVRGEANEFLLHDCDTMGGSSGGPVLGKVDNDIRIVGVNMGSIRGFNSSIETNLAVKVSRIRQ